MSVLNGVGVERDQIYLESTVVGKCYSKVEDCSKCEAEPKMWRLQQNLEARV